MLTLDLRLTDRLVSSVMREGELVDCVTDEFCVSVTDILPSIETDNLGTCVADTICVTDEFCLSVTDILPFTETDELGTCATDRISVCVTDRLGIRVADNLSLGVTNNPAVRLAAMERFTEFSLTDAGRAADGLAEVLGTMCELPAKVSLTERQLKPKPLTHLNCQVLY